MTRPWVAIQRNPRSGTGRAGGRLKDLIRRLRELDYRVRLFASRERFDDFVLGADHPPVAVVAAGGDGTVRSIVDRIRGIPFAVLPLGTENLIARYLRIPRDGRFVADMIAAGHRRTLDTVVLNEIRFLIMAGFGFDAEVVRRTDEARTGTISRLTYVQPIVQSLRKYEYVPLNVFLDDRPEPLVGHHVFLVNLPVYGFRIPIASSALGDDGLLDVRVFEKGSTFHILRYCYRLMRHQHETLADVTCAQARTIRVESPQPVPIQVDGDPAGWTPATVTVDPGSAEFYVPAP